MEEVTNNSRWSVLAIAERWRFYKIFSDCISKEINTDDGLESYIAYVQMLVERKELTKQILKKRKPMILTDVSYILGKDVKHVEKKYFNYPCSILNNKKIKINNYDQPDIGHKKLDIDFMLDEWIPIGEVIERWEILSPKDKYKDYWLECLWGLVKNGIVKIYDPSYNEYIDYSSLNPFGHAFGSSGGNFTSEVLKREDMIKAEIKLGFRRMLPNAIQHPDNYKYEQPTPKEIEFYESKTLKERNRYNGIVKIYVPSYNEYIDYSSLNPFGHAFGSSGGNFTSEVLKREDMIKAEIKLGFRRMLPNAIQHPDNYKYEQPTPKEIEFYESKTLKERNRYDVIKKVIIDEGWRSYGEFGDVTKAEIEKVCKEKNPKLFPKFFHRVFLNAKKAGCVPIKLKNS